MEVLLLLFGFAFIPNMIATSKWISVKKFKLAFKNCNVSDAELTKLPAPSLLSCFAQCSTSEKCNSFAWRSNECGLLPACGGRFVPPEEGDDGWDLYLVDGKTCDNDSSKHK